jgi:hypothetical protein
MPIGKRGWSWFGPRLRSGSTGMKVAMAALLAGAVFCYAFLGPLVFDASYWVLGKIARVQADRRVRVGVSIAFVVVYLVAVSVSGSTRPKPTGADATSTPLLAANATSSAASTAAPETTSPRATGTTAPTVATGPTQAPTAAPTRTSTPTSTPRPTAVPTPVLDFSPIKLAGKGSKVPKFTIPEDVPGIATITNSGGANFAVWSIGADGSTLELLVNVIGRYSGTVIFDTGADEHSVAFKVESSSSWTIAIKPIQAARLWDGASKLSGRGDDVVLLQQPISGLTTAAITHSGSSNFAVWSYSDSSRDLLVNEIGKYTGESLLPSGMMLLVVSADGAWTVTPE